MHTHSSSNTSRPFLKGQIVIRCNDSIEELASKISDALLGGVAFGGKSEGIYEEVPAMYAEVAGLRFVLAGYPGEHYVLESFPRPGLPTFGNSVTEVDISDHLLRSVGEIEGVGIDLE